MHRLDGECLLFDRGRMKKVLFIIPTSYDINDLINKKHSSNTLALTIPYGVLSLAAYIEEYSKCDIEVGILDLNLEIHKAIASITNVEDTIKTTIVKKIRNFTPDIIGISALFDVSICYLKLIVESCRLVNNSMPIVIGGGMATNISNDLLTMCPTIDACCYGEGEIPLLELVDSDNPHEYLKTGKSWVTRDSIESHVLPIHSFVNDLDLIPPLNYSLIDLKRYSGRSVDRRYAGKSLIEISIHTSRGCPFNCIYCANGSVHGKKIRYMSIDRIREEMKRMVSEFGMNVLLIEDDHFLSNKSRAKEILGFVSELNLRVEFPNGVAVYAMDEEIAKLLYEAGVTTISLAVESGSDFVLKNVIDKPHDVSKIGPAVKALRTYGISAHAFIVMGLPGELEKHRDETMRMIDSVGFEWTNFFLAIPVAGSRLYDLCNKENRLVSGDFNSHHITKCSIKVPGMTPEEMEDEVYIMNLKANFMNNYDIRVGKFEDAIRKFKVMVDKYPKHALAHYCLARAYEGMHMPDEQIDAEMDEFNRIIKEDTTWGKYWRVLTSHT